MILRPQRRLHMTCPCKPDEPTVSTMISFRSDEKEGAFMSTNASATALAAFAVSATLAAPALAFEITRYTQEGEGSVNSWILEGEDGIVLIDAQRSLSAGREAAEAVRATGKPLRAIVLTHPHPDHFGGLAAVLEAFPGTPVLASAETARIMREDANGFITATKEMLGSDAPDEQPLPTTTVEDGETLAFGGIELVADEVGRGEADSMTILYAPEENALFTGDVVDNGRTGFLMEGHSAEWLDQIAAVRADYAERDPTVYPGHGEAGGAALFDAQAEWIEAVRGLVAERLEGGVSEEETAEVVAAMEERYPDRPAVAPVPNLMAENVKALVAEMADQ